MKTRDLITTAISNTFRNRLRTSLTALAIAIGAFTLSLTLAVNNGLNSYIDETIASVGSEDTLTVTKPTETVEDGIAKYDPDAASGMEAGAAAMSGSGSVELLTQDDMNTLRSIEGVSQVHTVRPVSVDYVQLQGSSDDDRWVLNISPGIPGVSLPLAAGEQPDLNSQDHQIVLPRDYVKTFGLENASELVGKTVELGVSDPTGTMETVTAQVVGVSDPVLTSSSATATLNTALTDAIYNVSAKGLPDDQKQRWATASVTVETEDGQSIEDAVSQVQQRLSDAGYRGQTINEILGQFRAFFDAILIMLVAFAAIALVAGSLGIINTLLMSVQERTREIGLLKALGLTSRRVFALFSLESIVIGALSAAVGIVIPAVAAPWINHALSNGPLADLPGLTLISFSPGIIAGVAALIIAIAFLAGTLPAARAAGKDPIEALRYE